MYESIVYRILLVAIFWKRLQIFKMHSNANVTNYKTLVQTLLAHVNSAAPHVGRPLSQANFQNIDIYC
jgi:hypothetical protein